MNHAAERRHREREGGGGGEYDGRVISVGRMSDHADRNSVCVFERERERERERETTGRRVSVERI